MGIEVKTPEVWAVEYHHVGSPLQILIYDKVWGLIGKVTFKEAADGGRD